ncbi:MAG: apolipoprotein N-acyltransferase [Geothrix sp.]|uniref:apolipoprotein N-acyltransferase n=1 Tax=Geothrix sp. TaxID=1962974 RepID=UPI0017D5F2AF|nr:apolipoprotein N-acyltransferase [Geothrix sp.]NWJ41683.1 apolipoprotein N-acyltransferase [Geothrix sp.]WIL20336.1 MAG: apolipoprotein N-acyltransferase [Geothrix sp.]
MKTGWLLSSFSSLVLAAVFVLAFRFPGALGGWLEPAMALLFPLLLLDGLFKGRHAGWTWLTLVAGLVLLYLWVPQTLASKGGLPFGAALLGLVLLSLWEGTGLWLVAMGARWMFRRTGAPGAALAAGLILLAWETWGFHVYPWTWGAAFGSLPWTARAAAFLGASGLSALAWASGAWAAAALAGGGSPRRALAGPGVALGVLLLAGGFWYLLPRQPELRLDVALIQPNFPAGQRWVGMEGEMWRRSDALLKSQGLPQADRATLLLWPESSVLGRDDRQSDPRLAREAASRGVAWLYGTEGGLFNLVRGEVAERPAFLFAKTEPMPFGERMPGPEPVRRWLDQRLGFLSQEPGELKPDCAFVVPSVAGEVRVHPLICSEALLPERTRRGLALSGANLLSNHTNDGWFDRSIATDLHAAQIRLRATELGVPLVRATLTGKSGIFREDGRFELWGNPLTEGAYAATLRWRPVRTPARVAWLLPGFMAILLAGCVLLGWKVLPRNPR